MKWALGWMVAACVVITSSSFAQTVSDDAQLAGLWAASRSFGPEVRGPLWIERRGGALTAEVAGRRSFASVDGDAVSFTLPNGLGSFRGRFIGRGRTRIEGHWVQPGQYGYATPVSLEETRRGRWRGEVVPLDEGLTLYLMLTTGSDGIMNAFLRNPERNIGVYYRITRLERQGDRVQLIGRARRNAPETAVLSGRYDRETDRLSFDFGPRGGVFEFVRADPNAEAGFFPRGRQPASYVYAPPPARDDGWPVGTLEEVGIDRVRISAWVQAIIDTQMDSMDAPEVHGVLIARHGRLVLEEYFHNFGPDSLHQTRSAAKSVATLLVGAAMQIGAQIEPSTHVYETLGADADDPRKHTMTVEHLLTQSTGYFCDDNNDDAPGNENTMWEQTTQPDWWRFTLDLPMASAPGEQAVYCSVQPNLLGAILSRTTGQWLPDLFAHRIARPMGISNYALNLMPNGDAYLGGGMFFEPRDFMKFAQLLVDGGVWRGRRIVSTSWIERSVAPDDRIFGGDYGYLWWLEDYRYRGRTVRAVYASGNGGQIAMAIPELDLVIAFYSGNYNSRTSEIARRVYVPESILPAIADRQ